MVVNKNSEKLIYLNEVMNMSKHLFFISECFWFIIRDFSKYHIGFSFTFVGHRT